MSDERVSDSCADCDLVTSNVCDQVELVVCCIECGSKQYVFSSDECLIFPGDLQEYCHISSNNYGCVPVACLDKYFGLNFCVCVSNGIILRLTVPLQFMQLSSFCTLVTVAPMTDSAKVWPQIHTGFITLTQLSIIHILLLVAF